MSWLYFTGTCGERKSSRRPTWGADYDQVYDDEAPDTDEEASSMAGASGVPVAEKDWRAILTEVGFSDEDIAPYILVPELVITPEHEVRLWSENRTSLNPWISVQKDLDSSSTGHYKDSVCGSYWIGSKKVLDHFPNLLIKTLKHVEKYIKG